MLALRAYLPSSPAGLSSSCHSRDRITRSMISTSSPVESKIETPQTPASAYTEKSVADRTPREKLSVDKTLACGCGMLWWSSSGWDNLNLADLRVLALDAADTIMRLFLVFRWKKGESYRRSIPRLRNSTKPTTKPTRPRVGVRLCLPPPCPNVYPPHLQAMTSQNIFL